MSFQEINVREFSMKPFKMIGDQWMLVTAGDQIKYNTMTASWGGIGVMWGKNVAVTVIRPPALHQGICRIPRLLYPELLP